MLTAEEIADEKIRESIERISIRNLAAHWFVRTHDDDLSFQDRRQFLRWLKRSPEHVKELMRLKNMLGRLRGVKAADVAHRNRSPTPDEALAFAARPYEREGMEFAWTLLSLAKLRDLVLWADDSEPIAPRMAEAFAVEIALPETTLKRMAVHERQRRLKRTERMWWILGIVVTGIASPLVVGAIRALSAE